MGLVGATPTDLRPSPAPPPQPHHTTKSYKCIYLPQRGGVLRGLIQDPANGLLRIPLPRTLVNNTLVNKLLDDVPTSLSDYHHRAWCVPDHRVRDASHQSPPYPSAPPAAHHYQTGP